MNKYYLYENNRYIDFNLDINLGHRYIIYLNMRKSTYQNIRTSNMNIRMNRIYNICEKYDIDTMLLGPIDNYSEKSIYSLTNEISPIQLGYLWPCINFNEYNPILYELHYTRLDYLSISIMNKIMNYIYYIYKLKYTLLNKYILIDNEIIINLFDIHISYRLSRMILLIYKINNIYKNILMNNKIPYINLSVNKLINNTTLIDICIYNIISNLSNSLPNNIIDLSIIYDYNNLLNKLTNYLPNCLSKRIVYQIKLNNDYINKFRDNKNYISNKKYNIIFNKIKNDNITIFSKQTREFLLRKVH